MTQSPRILRRMTALALPLLLLLLSGCRPTVSDALSPEISETDLRAHIHVLASDNLEGRRAGERGYRTAARYVAEVLEDAGLEPLFRDADGKPSWFQPVPMVKIRYGENSSITLNANGVEADYPFLEDGPIPLFPGQHDAPKGFLQPLFIGYGISEPAAGWDDFAGLDLQGRLVVLLAGEPLDPFGFSQLPDSIAKRYRGDYSLNPHKLHALEEHGAAAVLVLPGNRMMQMWGYLRYRARWFDLFPDTMDTLSRFDPPFPVVALQPEAARALFADNSYNPVTREGQILKGPIEGVSVRWSISMKRIPVEGPNVAGIVRGSDPALANEVIVAQAHLDHLGMRGSSVYNGANDNASGVAAVLETAAAMAAHPPRRSILFLMTTAEEEGFWGARWFVAHPPLPLNSIVADVNLDEAGRLVEQENIEAIGDERFRLPLAAASRDAGLERPEFEPNGPGTSIFLRSDHIPFVESGIPALFLWTGEFPEYHSPLDVEERLDFPVLLHSTVLLHALLAELANEEHSGSSTEKGR